MLSRCGIGTHLLPVVETLVVVIQGGYALLSARDVVDICIYNVAG